MSLLYKKKIVREHENKDTRSQRNKASSSRVCKGIPYTFPPSTVSDLPPKYFSSNTWHCRILEGFQLVWITCINFDPEKRKEWMPRFVKILRLYMILVVSPAWGLLEMGVRTAVWDIQLNEETLLKLFSLTSIQSYSPPP